MSNVAVLPTDPAWRNEPSQSLDLDARIEAERLRIARELHDVVAYSFATIIVQAGVAARVCDERPAQLPEALRAITTVSENALGEFRRILGTLRREDVEAFVPSVGRLDALAESFESAGVPTRVVVRGQHRPLPVEVDRAAYRIVQESLTNVLRHSFAATASVEVSYAPGFLFVTVENDGRARLSPSHESAGNGIRGMRERAALLGGTLHAGPRPGGGFRVAARLPTSIRR
jgi:signal transduction histidine kinase